MSEQKMPFSRRRFLATTALGAAAAASGSLAMPAVSARAGCRSEARNPSSGHRGAVLFRPAGPHRRHHGGRRDQCRRRHQGAGGAKIDPVLGDAQSTPDGGTAEVEKMNSAEVSCIVGGYASSICLAASQAAARYDLPYVVDVGVAD